VCVLLTIDLEVYQVVKSGRVFLIYLFEFRV
jgi:hypothetical protein